MENRKVTPELRMLAGVLLPEFKRFGDPFLVKVAEELVDRTWREGVSLAPDAWYALRLGTLRFLKEKWGPHFGDFTFHLERAEEVHEGDFESYLDDTKICADEQVEIEGKDTFHIAEVVGPTKYEI